MMIRTNCCRRWRAAEVTGVRSRTLDNDQSLEFTLVLVLYIRT